MSRRVLILGLTIIIGWGLSGCSGGGGGRPPVTNNTDMISFSNGLAGLGVNGATVVEEAPGVFRLWSGPATLPASGELYGTGRGGKALLGFPGVDQRLITSSSRLSFSRELTSTSGSLGFMYLNLIVDGPGVTNNKSAEGGVGVIVAFEIGTAQNVTLDQNSLISGVYGGTIVGITPNSSTLLDLANLGLRLVNADTRDNGMPRAKVLAGLLILLGDSSGTRNNTELRVTNLVNNF